MSVVNYKNLKNHLGHRIVCVRYGKNKENIALECEDCNEVLLDFDKDSSVCVADSTEHIDCLEELAKLSRRNIIFSLVCSRGDISATYNDSTLKYPDGHVKAQEFKTIKNALDWLITNNRLSKVE